MTDHRNTVPAAASVEKLLMPGIGIKRWIILILAGMALVSVGLAMGILRILAIDTAAIQAGWVEIALCEIVGLALIGFSVYRLSTHVLQPYQRHQHGHLIDIVYAHARRHKGARVVAIGGGTGLPSVLRAMKASTSNLTAIVTVADDGGSSGRLRKELGVLPPGDLRNNIAALADDENLMTRLFQYRFQQGDLRGHAFGNLFISALAGVTGSLEEALIETERVLNIQGRVLPATLDDVTLSAAVRLPNGRLTTVHGESSISEAGGRIEALSLLPQGAAAYRESVEAILNADVVVIGPGSLYTSILPNLLIAGIRDALQTTHAHKVYVCNIATQPGETDGYTAAEHILTIENVIGRGVLQTILVNNAMPIQNAGDKTRYVSPAPPEHEVNQRYHLHLLNLVDDERPWRHDPQKLADAILELNSAMIGASARRHVKPALETVSLLKEDVAI